MNHEHARLLIDRQTSEGTTDELRELRTHLRECAECRRYYDRMVELEQALEQNEPVSRAQEARMLALGAPVLELRARPSSWKWKALALAAGIAAAIALFPPFAAEDKFRSTSGESPTLASEAIFLAIKPGASPRELRDGATLFAGEHLALRYSNTTSEFQSLTVLGWDGEKVQWYYPSSESGSPQAIASGPDARAVALPLDIRVEAEGALTLVAAFDVTPRHLAEQLKNKTIPRGPKTTVLQLFISE